MSDIRRIDYHKKSTEIPDFEIVDLNLFFSTRPTKLLEKDFRLNFWEIIYITHGKGKHYIDFKEYEYKSGDVIFVQKNQVHRFLVNLNAKGYIIHINEPFLLDVDDYGNNVFMEFIDQSFGSPIVSVDINEESTNRKLIEILYSEYNRSSVENVERLIKALFESFILSIRQQFTYKSRILKTSEYKNFTEFRKLVEGNYAKHLTLDDYSKMMGLSKKSINTATRAIVDLSAKEYVNNRLFLEIKRYLGQGKLLNYEISELLGFDEPANMTKFFKKHEGMSPREFKDKLG